MSEIKVFGHKSPDTDATMSAIVWAWFLNTHRNQTATAYVLGKPNTEALFVLDKWGHELPPVLESVSKGDDVTIVDTNNKDELFENINDAHFISIIDHHKLTGGLETSSPREIVIQPYASTMTVMYNIMNIEPESFPRDIAGLMLSGILSDTLEFRSPTTTPTDEDLASRLSKAIGVNMAEYASEMFDAKSDVSHFSEVELVKLDSKIFDIKENKVRISVIETTNPQIVFERKEKIIEALEEVRKEDEVDHVMFFIVDILKEESTLLTNVDAIEEIVEKAFIDSKRENGNIVLPGVVSRKKQIIPGLSN